MAYTAIGLSRAELYYDETHGWVVIVNPGLVNFVCRCSKSLSDREMRRLQLTR